METYNNDSRDLYDAYTRVIIWWLNLEAGRPTE